jgi:regulatory protein
MLNEVFDKLAKWCAYQERSQFDARRKLQLLRVSGEEAEQVIARLIEENFLNEERFAMAYAGGKFRIKRWGKQKIKVELRKRNVSDYSINKALASLGNDDYEEEMKKLIEKKMASSKYTDRRKLYFSVLKYVVSKGYESDKVSKELNKLIEDYSYES